MGVSLIVALHALSHGRFGNQLWQLRLHMVHHLLLTIHDALHKVLICVVLAPPVEGLRQLLVIVYLLLGQLNHGLFLHDRFE